jgi:hypothetical protein
LAGVHRHRLHIALGAHKWRIERVARHAAGNLLPSPGRSPDGGPPAASQCL